MLDALIYAKTRRALPDAQSDGIQVPELRATRYDELMIQNMQPDFGAIAEEGTYLTVNNAQSGLATAAAPTAFSATNPFLVIYNSEGASNPLAKRIIMDYAAFLATAAGTAAASVQFAVVLDQGNRYASGGTEITPNIVNVNGDHGKSSIAKVYAGNITASAASLAARTVVGNRYMKGAIPVAGDLYTVKFGGIDSPNFIGISGILMSLNNVPKIVIPANWSLLVHMWFPSQSGASSYAPEAGWIER